jgi:hypothetical protein
VAPAVDDSGPAEPAGRDDMPRIADEMTAGSIVDVEWLR